MVAWAFHFKLYTIKIRIPFVGKQLLRGALIDFACSHMDGAHVFNLFLSFVNWLKRLEKKVFHVCSQLDCMP